MEPEEDRDVQLMLAVRQGDQQAFETLFRKYIKQVAGFAHSLLGSRARAEEVAQETFVRVFQARHRYEPRARFKAWLFRIATNLCLSEIRRPEHRLASPRGDVNAQSGSQDEIESFPDPFSHSGEDALAQRETIETMRLALDRLPAQQRAALLLARLEGLPYAEVAHSLGCSLAAVKSLIHRATATLRSEMTKAGSS